jgi:purine nucleosidase
VLCGTSWARSGVQPDSDIPAAALFRSGVPIAMMSVDSTQLYFDKVKQEIRFSQHAAYQGPDAPLSSVVKQTPTPFDAMAVAYFLQPSLCRTQALDIEVDDKGVTHEWEEGR